MKRLLRLRDLVVGEDKRTSSANNESKISWSDISILNSKSEAESSRTHFEVFGLGLEASSLRKLPCPRLEDSTIFELLKFRWKTPEILRKISEDLCFGLLK